MGKISQLQFYKRHHLVAGALLLVMLPAVFADDKPGVPADQAFARLKAGNARFVRGQHQAADYSTERAKLVTGQQPYAILLTCSDSRVPPELVFDESLGKLFIVRVAGNVADPVTVGSIEYAAEHLGARLLVVLGHESCGAVKAALDGGHAPPNIEAILHKIQLATEDAKSHRLTPTATLAQAVEENVYLQMHDALDQSEVLHEMVDKKSLTLVGGVYQLSTGKVEWLNGGATAAPRK